MQIVGVASVFVLSMPDDWSVKEQDKRSIVVGPADERVLLSASVLPRNRAPDGVAAAFVRGAAEGFGAPADFHVEAEAGAGVERAWATFIGVKDGVENGWMVAAAAAWPARLIFASGAVEPSKADLLAELAAVARTIAPPSGPMRASRKGLFRR